LRKSRIIDIAFGGLYASTKAGTGEVSLFRLLDFNVDAVHLAVYAQKFDALPSAADVKALSPFVWHAPIDARTLLRDDDLHLIREDPLSREDLDGYVVYLEDMGVSEPERNELVQRVMALSRKGRIQVRLSAVDDTLVVEEP
jgi:hypothetical protein